MGKYVILNPRAGMMVQHLNQEDGSVQWTNSFDEAKDYEAAWKAEYEKDWIEYHVSKQDKLDARFINSQQHFDSEFAHKKSHGTFLSTGQDLCVTTGNAVETRITATPYRATFDEDAIRDSIQRAVSDSVRDLPDIETIIQIVRAEIASHLSTLRLDMRGDVPRLQYTTAGDGTSHCIEALT